MSTYPDELFQDSWPNTCQQPYEEHTTCEPEPSRVSPLREIPVGDVVLDCTPVTFKTPGQARNVLSCPFETTTLVTCTETTTVEVPLGNGCFILRPVTQTFTTPATCVCNLPPVCEPIPQVICPA